MTDERDYPTPRPRDRVPPTIEEQEERARKRDTDPAPPDLDLDAIRDALANAAEEFRDSPAGLVQVHMARLQMEAVQMLSTVLTQQARQQRQLDALGAALEAHQRDEDRRLANLEERLGQTNGHGVEA